MGLEMKKEDRLLFLLHKAQHILATHLKSEYRTRGIGVSPPQSLILLLLREENMQSMSDLSGKLSIDNSAITGLVDRLEKDGFVAREKNPKDRRGILIRIKQKGIRELKVVDEVVRKTNRDIKAGFAERQTEAFREILSSFSSKFRRS